MAITLDGIQPEQVFSSSRNERHRARAKKKKENGGEKERGEVLDRKEKTLHSLFAFDEKYPEGILTRVIQD